jgi:hypothetical protein
MPLSIPTDTEDLPMAEIEIHHHPHEHDATGQKVGLMVGVIGVLLAAATISAHREHTAAVIHRTEANDQWAYYQAKKTREHISGVGRELALALADATRAAPALQKFEADRAKYQADAESIKRMAEAKDQATEHNEARALRFDLGEGFLELGLVLTSLYFLGRQSLFPWAGGIAALLGLATALAGLLY